MFNLKQIRSGILIAIVLVLAMIWTKWQVVSSQNAATAKAAVQSNSDVPSLAVTPVSAGTSHPPALQAAANPVNISTTNAGQSVTVNTPLYTAKINLLGGNLSYAALNDYPSALHSTAPFVLLNTDPAGRYYVIESGLLSDGKLPDTLNFTSAATSYALNNAASLSVQLLAKVNGLNVVKTYTFYNNRYQVDVNYQVMNQSGAPVNVRFYGQLVRNASTEHKTLLNSYTSYTGAAISTPDNHYQKVKFSDIESQNLTEQASSGWVAMMEHYFISAWIPSGASEFYTHVVNGLYAVGMATPAVSVAPGQSITTGASLYMGPAVASNLSQAALYLDKTIDYGWLWFISELIFAVMKWVHLYLGNWGWSIIVVTLLIKLVFYPLSAKSYRSMAKMREVQPKMTKLKERFGDDRQKMGQAMMELYREEKVNPLGGCLPMLVQIPVFIALYWVIMESVEFRQAPFILWIHDLSVRDPYFILPVLMGLSMFVQQRLNPPMPDPIQAKVMMFFPLFLTVMFLGFPSGLVLYWLVNNCLSILQQWWIMRRYHQQKIKK